MPKKKAKAPATKAKTKTKAKPKAKTKSFEGPKPTMSGIDAVGEIAGFAWHLLEGKDKLSLAQVAGEIDAPRDQVMLALGWLAREGKLHIHDNGRTKYVSLL